MTVNCDNKPADKLKVLGLYQTLKTVDDPEPGKQCLQNANQLKTSSTVIHNILHKALTYKEIL